MDEDLLGDHDLAKQTPALPPIAVPDESVPDASEDGGHILGAVDWVRGGWAKARHQAASGLFDVAKCVPVAYAVSMALVTLLWVADQWV